MQKVVFKLADQCRCAILSLMGRSDAMHVEGSPTEATEVPEGAIRPVACMQLGDLLIEVAPEQKHA